MPPSSNAFGGCGCDMSGNRRLVELRPLRTLALRKIALTLYKANARWRPSRDIRRNIFDCLKSQKLALTAKKQILSTFDDILHEVDRWDKKHAEMFVEEMSPRMKAFKNITARASRKEHLVTFHGALIWREDRQVKDFTHTEKRCSIEIDDYKTAVAIVYNECRNWPQLRFQFACCYAMDSLLSNDFVFDKVRRSVFRQRLADHCVYDMWLRVLNDPKEWRRMFQEDRLLVDQLCVQSAQFAMKNGFMELTRYLWQKFTPVQREAIGFLTWKSVCHRKNSPEMIRFLCHELCPLNPKGMAALTWDCFYGDVCQSLESASTPSIDPLQKVATLLANFCPTLRAALLTRNDCRAISDAFWYQDGDTFGLLLEHVDQQQLRDTREVLDRIYDRKRTTGMRRLRESVLQRQATIQ